MLPSSDGKTSGGRIGAMIDSPACDYSCNCCSVKIKIAFLYGMESMEFLIFVDEVSCHVRLIYIIALLYHTTVSNDIIPQ